MKQIYVRVLNTSSWSLNDYYEDDDTIKFRCNHDFGYYEEDDWFVCDEENCQGIAEYEQENYQLSHLGDDDGDYQYDMWKDITNER